MFQFNNRRILDRVRSSGRLARAATGLDDEFSKHMAGSCLIQCSCIRRPYSGGTRLCSRQPYDFDL